MPAANPIKTCPGCRDAAVRATLSFEQQCSPCRKKERHRLWRQENPSAMAEGARRWRTAGNKTVRPEGYAERHRERERLRYQTSAAVRERAKAYARYYRKNNPEKVKALRAKWLADNPDYVRKYNQVYMAKFYKTYRGIEQQKRMRLKHRNKRKAGNAAYNARRYGEHGLLEGQFLYELHKWQDHCCAYCNTYLNGKETIEHIVPLNEGGRNLPHNTVLVCHTCNCSKQDTLLDTWVTPVIIQPVPRFHSQHGTKQVFASLTEAGIATMLIENYILLPNGRKLFVLSSFWLAERLQSPVVDLRNLAAAHFDAVFTFDFEWQTHGTALLNSVVAKAGQAVSIGARELQTAVPTLEEARAFLNQWHIQGFTAGKWYYGLRDGSGMWRAMCVANNKREGTYTLDRLAFNGHVAGGFSRLVKALVGTIKAPGQLVTYADSRLSDGEGYKQAGFVKMGESVPSYHFVNATGMYHWNAYTKQAMARKVDYFEPSWPLWRLARTNGLWRIDDLPLRRFTLNMTG